MIVVLDVVILFLELYSWVLLAVVLLSWLNPDPHNPLVRFLRQVTDPILLPFRRLLMPLTMRIRIDFSPIIAFLLIGLLQNVLVRVKHGGLSAEVVAWSVLDGVLIFFATLAIFFFIAMLARIIVEATGADRWNPIVRFIYTISDPIVFRFRSFRGRGARVDFAPVVAAVLSLLAYLLINSLRAMLP